MRIVDNKALLLKVENPAKVTTVIPKSKQLGTNEVLVNWGFEEAKVLRNLNIKAPSPIEGRYDWPGKYKPFKHQIETAAFLTMNPRAYCFSEMGVGKTASAIWASDYLLKNKIINRVLIVCPLSIMDAAWRNDLFTVAMHRAVDVAHGSADKRRKVIQSNAEYVIINFDGIKTVHADIANGGFDLIIIDEVSAYKNAQTDRWKTLNSLIKPTTWLWMMTGTPAAQSPVDAYGLAKMMNPNSVPRYFGSFRDMVMRKVTNFKWAPKPDAMETVHRVLQPAIRFTKEECLDMPPMIYVKRDVPLSKQQEKYYKEFKKKMVMYAAGEEITAPNAAIIMNKLLQLSCGAMYSDNNETIEFDISSRYKVLQEIIAESSKKVLVFAPFKHVIDLLMDMLKADKISCDMIRGDVSPGKRTEIFARFQEHPDPKVLVIQPQAAAHGVTLTAANTVVWWGPTSSLEIYHQANARVHRSGQTHPCTVVQLQGSPVEKHVYTLLDNRIDVHSKIVELYKKMLD